MTSPGSARATEPRAPGAVLELRLGARLGSADTTGAAAAAGATDRPAPAEAGDPPEPAAPLTLERPCAIDSSRAASIVS